MSYYVYKFLDADSETMYFGRTENLKRRIERQHFVRSAKLPKECIDQVKIIFYAKFKYQADAELVEKYLICKYKPKYNKQEAKKDVSIEINEPNWVECNKLKVLIPIKEIEQYKFQINTYKDRINELECQVGRLVGEEVYYSYYKTKIDELVDKEKNFYETVDYIKELIEYCENKSELLRDNNIKATRKGSKEENKKEEVYLTYKEISRKLRIILGRIPYYHRKLL